MTKQCPVCKQMVNLKKDDDIALCVLTRHITYSEVNQIQDEETCFFDGEDHLEEIGEAV